MKISKRLQFPSFLAIFSSVITTIISNPAQAISLRWDLVDVNLQGGGMVNGSFLYDQDTNQITDVNINTPRAEYIKNTVLSSNEHGNVQIKFEGPFTLTYQGYSRRGLNLYLELEDTLANKNAGDVVNLLTYLDPNYRCYSYYHSDSGSCELYYDNDDPSTGGDDIAIAQFLTTGSLRAVPEPLTLLGASAALGFGAFFKRKLK